MLQRIPLWLITWQLTTQPCWFHGLNIISAASNVVFWTFFRAKTCCVVCHAYCFCYGGTNMAGRNVWKTTFHSTFAFEGTSMEPTTKRHLHSVLHRLDHLAFNLYIIHLEMVSPYVNCLLFTVQIKCYIVHKFKAMNGSITSPMQPSTTLRFLN